MTRPRVRLFLLFGLLPPAAGCFEYTRIETASARLGTPVRAHLSEPRDVYVGNLMVPSLVLAEGDLIRVTGDSAIIAVQAVEQSDASRRGTSRALVALPRSGLDHLEEKRVDWKRSALVAGGLAIGGALLAGSLFGGESEGTVGTSEPDPIAARLRPAPLLRIPIPF